MSDPLNAAQPSRSCHRERLVVLDESADALSTTPAELVPECFTPCKSWMTLSVLLALCSVAGMALQTKKGSLEAPIATEHFQLDINRAGVAELRVLPGIGPSLANRIVDFRQQYGPFSDPSELMRVSGLGHAILKELSPFLTVSPEWRHHAE